jgi:hypothetical protein
MVDSMTDFQTKNKKTRPEIVLTNYLVGATIRALSNSIERRITDEQTDRTTRTRGGVTET